MNSEPRKKTARTESCGNDGAVESLENQNQVFHSSHRPLEIAPTAARFPHSHSSDDEVLLSYAAKPRRPRGFAPPASPE